MLMQMQADALITCAGCVCACFSAWSCEQGVRDAHASAGRRSRVLQRSRADFDGRQGDCDGEILPSHLWLLIFCEHRSSVTRDRCTRDRIHQLVDVLWLLIYCKDTSSVTCTGKILVRF